MQQAKQIPQKDKKLEEPPPGYWPQTYKWIIFETECNNNNDNVTVLAFANNMEQASLALEQYANGTFQKIESNWMPKALHHSSNQVETVFDEKCAGHVFVPKFDGENAPHPDSSEWPYDHWLLDEYDEEESPDSRTVFIIKGNNNLVVHKFDIQRAPQCFPAEMERRTQATDFFEEIDKMTAARLRGECGGEFVAIEK